MPLFEHHLRRYLRLQRARLVGPRRLGEPDMRGGAAPHNKQDTSYAAAAVSVEEDLPRMRLLVWRAVRECGAYGATCDELEVELNMRHQTCSARLNDLYKRQDIYDSDLRRPTRTESRNRPARRRVALGTSR